MDQPLPVSITLSSSGDSLPGPGLRFNFLLLCLQYTIAATATIKSTRGTAANVNSGQRLGEDIGLLVGLVEGEGITLPGRLAEEAEGTGVIPMNNTYQIGTYNKYR